MEWLVSAKGLQEVSQRCDEGVLVSHDVAGLPEICRVRMSRPGYQYIARTLHWRRFGRVEKYQTIHIFEVERKAAFRSVHFKSVPVAPAYTEAAGFKTAQTAIRDTYHDLHGVINLATGNIHVRSDRDFSDFIIH